MTGLPHSVRPTVVDVDLAAIVENLQLARRVAPHAAICAVVKADAYGHGIVPVGRALAQAGVDWLGVVMVEEAVALRDAGIETPILVWGEAYDDAYDELVGRAITPTLSRPEQFAALHAALQRQPQAVPFRVHVAVDSGMVRLGVAQRDLPALLQAASHYPTIRIDGLSTHFAKADVVGDPFNTEQLQRWNQVQASVAAHGIAPHWRHTSNSSATLSMPPAHGNLVRCGLMLYGLEPLENQKTPLPLRPALTWRTAVVALYDVATGVPVSYGCRWVSQRPSRIATLPVGYADGYFRRLGNRAEVLICGQRAPVVGTVCMDLCMVDVTDVSAVRLGSEVILVGEQGGLRIDATDVASWADTISYEIICGISKRVPRRYWGTAPH